MTRPPALAVLESRLAGIGRAPREVAVVAYFDPEWRLSALRHAAGGRGHVAVPVRGVVRDAIGFRARHVVMAHGHPSGDAAPSDADLAYTRVLARTLEAVGVVLHDHWVMAGERVTSFRAMGVL